MKPGMPIMTKMQKEPQVFSRAKFTIVAKETSHISSTSNLKELHEELQKISTLHEKMMLFAQYQYKWKKKKNEKGEQKDVEGEENEEEQATHLGGSEPLTGHFIVGTDATSFDEENPSNDD